MKEDLLSVNRRAYRINQDSNIYGTFAEIGAGQEVARHFFQAGQASYTIAKTMSAYDMTFSDAIYGKGERYVSFMRLKNMLNHEFELLQRRLKNKRAHNTCFFTFADTVTTSSVNHNMGSILRNGNSESQKFSLSKKAPHSVSSCHGWMGIRFQLRPKGPQNDVILHVRMLDRFRLQQQEALGVLGVNLIYSAFYLLGKNKPFVDSLVSNLHRNRIEIDFLKLEGEDLKKWNQDEVHLDLVKQGLTEAILFGPGDQNKEHLFQMDEVLHGKSLFLMRDYLALEKKLTFKESKALMQRALESKKNTLFGFHSVTHGEALKASLRKKRPSQDEVQMIEMCLKFHSKKKEISYQRILGKIKSFNRLKIPVLVTSFVFPFHLKNFLRRYTQSEIFFLFSQSHLKELFSEEIQEKHWGGKKKLLNHKASSMIHLLEVLSSWFDEKVFFYIFCLEKERSLEKCFNDQSQLLFQFLKANHKIMEM